MATLKCETYLTLTATDLGQILTEELCRSYGMLGELSVSAITENADGDFDLVLSPRPVEQEPEPKLQAVS